MENTPLLNNIIERNEQEWEPRIDYGELARLSLRLGPSSSEEGGKKTTPSMSHPAILPQDLCAQTEYILWRIEQISAQSLHALQKQGCKHLRRPVGAVVSVFLACASVSALPTSLPLNFCLSQPELSLSSMLSQLEMSPLFLSGLSIYELKSALTSLDLLFTSEDVI